MLRITDLKLPLDHDAPALVAAILARLGIAATDLTGYSIARRGYDARKRGAIALIYSIDVDTPCEAELLQRARDSADTKLEDLPKPPEGESLTADQTAALAKWLKETLGERVAEVKSSDRLVDSPAVALNADKFMSPHLRRMMKAMNKDGAESPLRVNLEINPRHAVIRKLATTRDSSPERAQLVAEQLFDNALISAGLLEDTTKMVQRLYKLLEQV